MPLSTKKRIISLFELKKWPWLITAISIISACALSIEMQKHINQIKSLKNEQKLTKSLTSEGYRVSLYSQIYLNNDLWKELKLYTLKDEKSIPFRKLASNTTLVLYIHSNMCTPCIEHEIKNFLGLHENHGFNMKNSVVILAGFKKEVIQKIPTLTPILSSAYYIPKNEVVTEFENLSKPCMILFKSGYPNLVYLSSGSKDAYFEAWKDMVLKSGL